MFRFAASGFLFPGGKNAGQEKGARTELALSRLLLK